MLSVLRSYHRWRTAAAHEAANDTSLSGITAQWIALSGASGRAVPATTGAAGPAATPLH
jgi:hypothetical protein